MTDYKIWLGYIATAVALLSYVSYFHGIYKGKTKPHAFTWLVWGILNIIGFAAVLVAGGGTGSWVLGVNAILCLVVAAIGFKQGIVQYDLFDWLALIGAFVGMILWALTKNPLFAVILVSLSDAIGFIPSFRKAYRVPFEENPESFAIGILYYIIALFALQTFTITTSLYHLTIIIVDFIFVTFILIRRRQLKQK